jgi:hypothetical protein
MTHFIGLMFPQHVGYDSDIMLSGERDVCPRFLGASSLRKLYMRFKWTELMSFVIASLKLNQHGVSRLTWRQRMHLETSYPQNTAH